jgi:hypothetical protein
VVDEDEVTELDVVYGSEATGARWGWQTAGTVVGGDGRDVTVEVVTRKGIKRASGLSGF